VTSPDGPNFQFCLPKLRVTTRELIRSYYLPKIRVGGTDPNTSTYAIRESTLDTMQPLDFVGFPE
jgi:hypothetical protein